MVLELRVTDDKAVSQPVLATAVLDSLPTWMFENDTASVKVLDGLRNTYLLDVGGAVSFRDALALDVASPRENSTLYYLSGGDARIARSMVKDMCPSCSGPMAVRDLSASVSAVTALRHERGSPVVWVVSIDITGGTRVDVLNATDLSPLGFISLQGAFFSDNDPFARIDRQGRLWVGTAFSDVGVTCVQYSETTVPAVSECGNIPMDPGYLLTGLALRDVGPAGQEVWAMQSRNFLTGVVGSPTAKVFTTVPGGDLLTVSVNGDDLAFEPDLAFTLEFVDRNLVWLNLFGEGLSSAELCHSDPTVVPPDDGPLDPAVIPQLCLRAIAPFEATFDTLSDPLTGTFVGLGLEGHSLNRMTLGGQSSRIVSAERFGSLVHVDGGAGVWSVLEGSVSGGPHLLSRGRGSAIGGVILEAPIGTTLTDSSLDYASGDIWSPALFPPAAARFSPDGSRTDFVTSVIATDADGDEVGSAVPLILPGGVFADPHRGHVWVVNALDPSTRGGREILLFEPYARRPKSAPNVAKGVRGLPVPLLAAEDMGGEVVRDAAVQPDTGDLIVMTATTNGLAGCPATVAPAYNYYLRRIAPVVGGTGFTDAPAQVACGYVQAMATSSYASPATFRRGTSALRCATTTTRESSGCAGTAERRSPSSRCSPSRRGAR